MQNKEKFLVLTPRFPFPVIGGDRLRIYFLCKELSKEYDLTLLSLCETQEEMEMDVSYDKVFSRVERVFLPKWRSYINCLLSLPTKKPLQVAYYHSIHFKNKIHELLPGHAGGLAHLVRTGGYIKSLDIPKFLEMTDAISMNYERVGKVAKSSGLKNFVYSIEQKRLKVYEEQIAKDFDCSLLVSQVDKDYLYNPGSSVYSKVLVCSNGVDTDSMIYELPKKSKQLVFIGNLFSVQNLDAALWFSNNIMPLLRRHGDFTFKVIGRIKDKDRQKFSGIDGVVLTGAVDSVVAEARDALAGICSVRLGAGVQNKILEYMALGLPAITSSVGLEGLEAKPDKDILVANAPEEYVEVILSLAKDYELTKKISTNGRKYVETYHSWQSRMAPAIDMIGKILKGKKELK
ncbi:MAG: glycosyltransferase [Gammaproteobacteria bacterium]|nr:MAG: glycosyltransferase [Gammaproteobacteria bacterium]